MEVDGKKLEKIKIDNSEFKNRLKKKLKIKNIINYYGLNRNKLDQFF